MNRGEWREAIWRLVAHAVVTFTAVVLVVLAAEACQGRGLQ